MLLKIAIPVNDGRLLGHLGETKQFALVETDRQSRVTVCTQIVAAPAHEPGSFPRWLREHSVHALIVGQKGIGQRALDNLVHHGVEVCGGRPGLPVEALVVAYLGRQLSLIKEGCQSSVNSSGDQRACRLTDYLKPEREAKA